MIIRALIWTVAASAYVAVFLASSALASPEIRVSGNSFLRDGQPWVAEGVVLVGLLAPVEKFKRPAYARAYRMYGPKLFEEIREYGADTVRIKVRQEGLDLQSRFYLPGYREEVLRKIEEVREQGFVVIVSMLSLLAEAATVPKGTPTSARVPSADTARAWKVIIGEIAQDRGILLEIYDEPGIKDPTPENWEAWRQGTQMVVSSLREEGAENVLLINGLRTAHILEGSPEIMDPLNQLGFAVHPYLFKRSRTFAQWENQFGRFALEKPVMATEWNAISNRQAQCFPDQPKLAAKFLAYLRERRIGLVIWAFDLPGVRIGNRLSSFKNHQCGPRASGAQFGAGELVRDYFQAY